MSNVRTHIDIKSERWTPQMAERALARAAAQGAQNRRISEPTVTAHKQAMLRPGAWRPVSVLCFDQNGKLVNGFHRLTALSQLPAGTSVVFLVMRGLTMEDVLALDIHRRRSVIQQIAMFYPEIANRNNLVSYVNMCCYILTGRRVQLLSYPDFEEWRSVFAEGIAWAADYCVSDRVLRNGPVAGALAFAYKKDPERVMDFARELREGASLPGSHPVTMLRNALAKLSPTDSSATYRLPIARRVLNCTKAFLENERMQRVHDSEDGRAYFLQSYRTSEVLDLAIPWMPVEEVQELRARRRGNLRPVQ